MAVEMKTLVCPGPPKHEFKIPKGRGRPPRYCEDHKPNGKQEEKSKVSEDTRQAPPRSGPPKGETRQGPPRRAPKIQSRTESENGGDGIRDEGIRRLPPPGRPDTKSRAKAESAADRVSEQASPDEGWPRGINRRPMAKIEFSASELIPTGQYANVAVGPVRITAFVDLDRRVDDEYFSEDEKRNLIGAANELAEMVEHDVVAVQRNIVLESIQEQLDSNGK